MARDFLNPIPGNGPGALWGGTDPLEANGSGSPPVISNLDGDFVTFTEGGARVLIDDLADATVTDADSADFNGGTLTVTLTSNGDASEDVLLFDQSGTVSLSGTTVLISGVAIGTITSNGTGGNDLAVAFNAAATPARVQALVRAIAYNNTDMVDPSLNTRQVMVSLTDGDGSDTALVLTAVIINGVNDAPAGANDTITAPPNVNYIFAATDFGFTDQDGNILLEVVFTGVTGGKLYVNSSGNGFSAADEITGFPATVAVGLINAGRVAFVPTTVGAGSAMVNFQVRDDGGTANGGQNTDPSANTLTFNVVAPSANPDLQLPDTLNYTENEPAALLAPNGVVTDSDSPNFNGGSLTVHFAANGTQNDWLAIRNQGTGAGQIGVNGSEITFGGTVIGTFTGGDNGTDLVVTFDADANSGGGASLGPQPHLFQ